MKASNRISYPPGYHPQPKTLADVFAKPIDYKAIHKNRIDNIKLTKDLHEALDITEEPVTTDDRMQSRVMDAIYRQYPEFINHYKNKLRTDEVVLGQRINEDFHDYFYDLALQGKTFKKSKIAKISKDLFSSRKYLFKVKDFQELAKERSFSLSKFASLLLKHAREPEREGMGTKALVYMPDDF